jgi:hypothetical protein
LPKTVECIDRPNSASGPQRQNKNVTLFVQTDPLGKVAFQSGARDETLQRLTKQRHAMSDQTTALSQKGQVHRPTKQRK